MPHMTSRTTMLLWLIIGLLNPSLAAPSKLRVAACDPGTVPYTSLDENGTTVGYDVGVYRPLS